jgi:SPP1 gp7 family putative phage head morphogenesis protein
VSKNDDLLDLTIRRAIFIERLSTKEARDLEVFLKEVRLDLEQRIRRYEGSNLRRSTILDRQIARLDELIADVYGRLGKEMRKKQRALSAAEAKWHNEKLIGLGFDNVQDVTGAQVYAAMRANPANGLFVRDMIADLPKAHKRRLTQALRISYVEGESASTAISRVRAITGGNRRGTELLVRTANAHIATSAERVHTKKNKGLYDRYQWSSVLDRRTTPVCRGRDGRIWPIGPSGEMEGPVPPAHARCRSHVVSLLRGEDDPETLTYGKWIKGQSAAVQDEVLGPGRGKLLRQGKYTVDQFIDNKGKQIPLEELRK